MATTLQTNQEDVDEIRESKLFRLRLANLIEEYVRDSEFADTYISIVDGERYPKRRELSFENFARWLRRTE